MRPRRSVAVREGRSTLSVLGSGRSPTASRHVRRAIFSATALVALLAGTSGTEDAVANGDTRTIHILHEHTKESASITFKRWGRYDSDALNQLNWLLRDWRSDQPTRMDPRLFDIVWEVYRSVGASEPVHVVSAYRSPETNAALRARSRRVAEYSQHMLGKAMDFYIPDADMARVRATAMRLQHGGVGFYPHSAHRFIHLDAGSVRAWPRMTRDQLVRLFPDGKTVHLPTDNKPLPRYEEAKAEILARGGSVAGLTAYASAEEYGGRRRSLWATLFGGGDDEDSEFYGMRGRGRAATTQLAAAYAPSGNSDDAGTRGILAYAAPEPASVRPQPETQVASLEATPSVSMSMGLSGRSAGRTPAADEGADAEPAVALGLTPMPPRRPDDIVALAATTFVPLPPTRPVELAAVRLTTRSDVSVTMTASLPPAPSRAPDDRSQLRALFAAVASDAGPVRARVATARAKPQAEAPGGLIGQPGAGLALGFSAKPADLAGSRFTGPAVKALPTLR